MKKFHRKVKKAKSKQKNIKNNFCKFFVKQHELNYQQIFGYTLNFEVK
jgi:hypothetical protein